MLKTDMQTGHAGSLGRYEQWRDLAFEYAFLLRLAGVED
jgi:oligopeptidase B